MKIFFCGDVVGRSGRDVILNQIDALKEYFQTDIFIVNGENAAHGFGITKKIASEFLDAGVDCITTGNHVWDQRDIIAAIGAIPKILRPHNMPENNPGSGIYIHQTYEGQKCLVIHLMGRVFMDPMDDPFQIVSRVLDKHILGKTVDAIFVDMHAETTAEKMSMAQYLDGRVSAVIGTHTHIPTADAQILNRGTAYLTDAGMCGDYDSVIGMDKDIPIHRITTKMPATTRMQPAKGEATLCGVCITTDDKTGLAKSIEAVRIGPRLKNTHFIKKV